MPRPLDDDASEAPTSALGPAPSDLRRVAQSSSGAKRSPEKHGDETDGRPCLSAVDEDGGGQPDNQAQKEDGRNRERMEGIDYGGAEDEDGDEAGEEDDGGGGILFSCRCESAKSVATLLSCLRSVSSSSSPSGGPSSSAAAASHSRSEMSVLTADERRGGGAAGGGSAGSCKAQHATVFAGPDALTFHVRGLGGQSQASVDMQAGLFSDYYVGEQVVPILEDEDEDQTPTSQQTNQPKTETIRGGEFGINLTTVLECLHVLGTASLDRTKLCLSYDVRDAIFKIELLEDGGGPDADLGGGVLSTCAIPGLAVPDDELEDGSSSLAVAFRSSPIVARAILKSDFLRDAVVELGEVPGASSATVAIGPGGVEFAAAGHSSECHVSLPRSAENAEVYVSLECDPPRLHARSYPLHSVLSAMRGLEIGSETCVSINARGMVAIQHQVLDEVGSGRPNFVDFIMGCLQDEDDEDEDENEAAEDESEAVVDLDEGSVDAVTQGSTRFLREQLEGTRRKRAPQASTAATSGSSAVWDGDRSSGDDSDGKESDADEAVDGAPLFGTIGEIESKPARKKTYRRPAKDRRAGQKRSGSASSSRSPSPTPRALGQSQKKSQSGSHFDGTDEEENEMATRKKRPSPESRTDTELKRRRARKRVSRPAQSAGGSPNENDQSEEKSSDNQGNESEDAEASLDVIANIVSTASRSKTKSTRNLADGTEDRSEDEPPSSPELMYGDTRLEGPSQQSPQDDGSTKMSRAERRLNGSRRLRRSQAATRSSRYDESDDTDNDEGF